MEVATASQIVIKMHLTSLLINAFFASKRRFRNEKMQKFSTNKNESSMACRAWPLLWRKLVK